MFHPRTLYGRPGPRAVFPEHLTEVCARCRYYGVHERKALESVERGLVELEFSLGEPIGPVLGLMNGFFADGLRAPLPPRGRTGGGLSVCYW